MAKDLRARGLNDGWRLGDHPAHAVRRERGRRDFSKQVGDAPFTVVRGIRKRDSKLTHAGIVRREANVRKDAVSIESERENVAARGGDGTRVGVNKRKGHIPATAAAQGICHQQPHEPATAANIQHRWRISAVKRHLADRLRHGLGKRKATFVRATMAEAARKRNQLELRPARN